jgi:hypothetical protein
MIGRDKDGFDEKRRDRTASEKRASRDRQTQLKEEQARVGQTGNDITASVIDKYKRINPPQDNSL